MATADQISRLRRVTALEENDPIYTDSLLGGMIDDLGFEGAASQVWKEKAASVAGLVDTTESGSSRSLSQLRKGYMEMATGVGDPGGSDVLSGSFTVEIERV
jgi:hypothetical protein